MAGLENVFLSTPIRAIFLIYIHFKMDTCSKLTIRYTAARLDPRLISDDVKHAAPNFGGF